MNDFENIKKKYGESFAKFCRSKFPSILEQEGTLSEIIESRFAPSKFLFEDICNHCYDNDFVNYINE